jgi:hypothetical protein
MPASPTGTSEPWTPQITEAEDLTSLDAMIEYEPVIMFTPSGAGVTTVDLADDGLAVAIDDAPADESLALDLADFKPGCRLRLFGRWAHVELDRDELDRRMFVIERYEHGARPAHSQR